MLASIDRLTHRFARQAVLLVMSSFLALAAAGVAAAALYYCLLRWMSQPEALGLVALILLIASLLLAMVARGTRKGGAVKTADAQEAAGFPAVAAVAGEMASNAVKADPLGAMLGAGAIGFILESRPDLDHALLQQVLRQFTR